MSDTRSPGSSGEKKTVNPKTMSNTSTPKYTGAIKKRVIKPPSSKVRKSERIASNKKREELSTSIPNEPNVAMGMTKTRKTPRNSNAAGSSSHLESSPNFRMLPGSATCGNTKTKRSEGNSKKINANQNPRKSDKHVVDPVDSKDGNVEVPETNGKRIESSTYNNDPKSNGTTKSPKSKSSKTLRNPNPSARRYSTRNKSTGRKSSTGRNTKSADKPMAKQNNRNSKSAEEANEKVNDRYRRVRKSSNKQNNKTATVSVPRGQFTPPNSPRTSQRVASRARATPSRPLKDIWKLFYSAEESSSDSDIFSDSSSLITYCSCTDCCDSELTVEESSPEPKRRPRNKTKKLEVSKCAPQKNIYAPD